jgi:hypothetical protein
VKRWKSDANDTSSNTERFCHVLKFRASKLERFDSKYTIKISGGAADGYERELKAERLRGDFTLAS